MITAVFSWAQDMAIKLTVKPGRLQPAKSGSRLSSVQIKKAGSGVWGRGRGGRPWRRLRQAVLLRDKYTCRYCGRVSIEDMDVDHIINLASGGTDDMANLQTLCKSCHKRKTATEQR